MSKFKFKSPFAWFRQVYEDHERAKPLKNGGWTEVFDGYRNSLGWTHPEETIIGIAGARLQIIFPLELALVCQKGRSCMKELGERGLRLPAN